MALNTFTPTIDADNMENTPFPGLSQLVILDKELKPVHQIDLDYYVEDLASDAGSDYIAIKHHYGIDSIRDYAFDEDRWGIFATLLDVKRSTPCFQVKSDNSLGVIFIIEAGMLIIDQYRLDKEASKDFSKNRIWTRYHLSGKKIYMIEPNSSSRLFYPEGQIEYVSRKTGKKEIVELHDNNYLKKICD